MASKTTVVSSEDVKASCEEPKHLAFLPNRMPTYKLEDDTHMFSLFYETPTVDQGWRVMLRGLHLPKLLVDKATIDFLESVKGGVDWKPLPPNNNSGTAGIIFDANTIESKDELATLFGKLNLSKPPDTNTTDHLEIKVEEEEEESKVEKEHPVEEKEGKEFTIKEEERA